MTKTSAWTAWFHPAQRTQRTQRSLLSLRFGRCVSYVCCVCSLRCVGWKPRFTYVFRTHPVCRVFH